MRGGEGRGGYKYSSGLPVRPLTSPETTMSLTVTSLLFSLVIQLSDGYRLTQFVPEKWSPAYLGYQEYHQLHYQHHQPPDNIVSK